MYRPTRYLGWSLCAVTLYAGSAPLATAEDATSAVDNKSVEEIVVQAPEPRFAAPTRRDRIGRIWAPVFINGRGPFRLVLDSGASHSCITAHVAEVLGLPLDQSPPIMLRGVTGSAMVPTVRIDSFTVGDLTFDATTLPIVTDALSDADGILGTAALPERRIYIDFHHDLITIARSHNQRADPGFITIPFQLLRGKLPVVEVLVGGIHTKAIIDTGGQVSIANMVLHKALLHRWSKLIGKSETIQGVTADTQQADSFPTPPIQIGAIQVRNPGVAYGDMHIFEYLKLSNEPVMLIGMDALGLFDILIIDYRRHELQIRMQNPR